LATAKFQLYSVSIEGFKGFTYSQTITFAKKHAFLFGKNYSGKSSVVEAIRWCLFGLAERPEREVRNAYYAPGLLSAFGCRVPSY
jgi:chromosome segregation ATPase